jgi:hypothetical protein
MALVLKDGTSVHIGRVISIHANSPRIMSDIWGDGMEAKYIEDGTGIIQTVQLVTWDMGSEYAQYDYKKCTVDADETALAEYETSQYKQFVQQYTHNAEKLAREIRKGDKIRVTNGRTAKGSIGIVFWMDRKSYGTGYYNSRTEWKYGIALSNRKKNITKPDGREFESYADVAFVWGHNVEKMGWEELVDTSHVETEARKSAAIARESVERNMVAYFNKHQKKIA